MDDTLRCTASSKQSGTRCKRSRSPGLDKCALHCGLSKAERERAAQGARARAEAAQALVRFDAPAVTNPYRELARIAGQQIAYKDKVGEILNRLSSDELRYAGSLRGEQTRAEIGMWQDSTRQCVSVLSVLAKLDVETAWVALEEQKAHMIADAFAAALAVAGLPADRAAIARAEFTRRLRTFGDEDDGVITGVVIPPRQTGNMDTRHRPETGVR